MSTRINVSTDISDLSYKKNARARKRARELILVHVHILNSYLEKICYSLDLVKDNVFRLEEPENNK